MLAQLTIIIASCWRYSLDIISLATDSCPRHCCTNVQAVRSVRSHLYLNEWRYFNETGRS